MCQRLIPPGKVSLASPRGKYPESFRPFFLTKTHQAGRRKNSVGTLGPIGHDNPIVPESGTKLTDFSPDSNLAAKMTRSDGKAGAQVRLLDPGYEVTSTTNKTRN